MKPLEILTAIVADATGTDATSASLPATPEAILDSPAFAMPCRLGDEPATLRRAPVEPSGHEMLALSVAFGDEPNTLRLARSPRFPDLDRLWDSRADVPEPILLALVEKECGPLFQLLENAVRKQLRLVGLMPDGGLEVSKFGSLALALSIPPNIQPSNPPTIQFSLTRSATVVSALGVLRNLDLENESIRSQTLPAAIEYAAFQLPEADLASLAPGDAILLPEIGSVPPRMIAGGRFVVDESGVAPFKDDAMCRVRGAAERTVSLGELFGAAVDSRGDAEARRVEPLCDSVSLREGKTIQLRLFRNGMTVATGRLDRLGDQLAFVVECLTEG